MLVVDRPIWLADPVERIIRLADGDASPADKILALAGGEHQDILQALEDQQAATLVAAYQQVQHELNTRIQSIYAKTFGAGSEPEAKDVVNWARSSELLSAVDDHLDALGVTTADSQLSSWQAGAALGFEQANDEMKVAAADFGIAPSVVFGHLDTVAMDLGMTAAVNDTRNLSDEMRSGVHQALTAGAISGEGIRGIQQRVDEVVQGATVPAGSRAELISRWATLKGYNASRSQVYADAAKEIDGLEQMWLVIEDDHTCPDCEAHSGETIPADGSEEFDATRSFANTPISVYGGVLEYPPLHPRCRCTLIPWHERWRGLSTLTPEDLQAQGAANAAANGFPAKTFPPAIPSSQKPVLRQSRAGRAVIRAQALSSIPESVRAKTIERFLTCWVGGA